MYVPNGRLLYDSIIHTCYKGCTDKQAVVYLKAVLISHNDIPCSWYEPRWTMHRQVYNVYSQVYAMYIACANTFEHHWIHLFCILYHVQTCIDKNRHVCSCMLVYIFVQTKYITCKCFRLSNSGWHSTFRIFLPIHKSVGHSNMLHQVSSTDQ